MAGALGGVIRGEEILLEVWQFAVENSSGMAGTGGDVEGNGRRMRAPQIWANVSFSGRIRLLPGRLQK
jgi:hypothetical protein